MKTSAMLIIVVVMLHCAALGALFFIQGCGTTAGTGTPPSTATQPTMPPTTKDAVNYPPPKTGEKAPVAKPDSKELPKALETTEYVVRSGDSIGSIAKQYGLSRGEIADLNKLSDANKLRVGQKLMLPGRLKIKAAAAASAKPAPKSKAVETPVAAATPGEPLATATAEAAPVAGKEYVVLQGDSLSKIAKKCGTKISALREANKLQGDKLKVGQKLIIPEATAAAAVPTAAAVPVAPAPETPVPEAPVAPAMEIKPAAATAAPVAMTIPAATPAPAPATPAALAAPAAAAAPATPVTAPAKAVANSGITHIVQSGEDINSIAKLYAVTVDEIVELNQFGANRTVKVGQRLKIP